jgi:predicted metalloprotease with PDZ domain
MIRILIVLAASLALSAPASAQSDINYDVSWDSAEDHYFNVSIEIGGLTGQTVNVQMPAWRPGRYIMQNYVRYVVDFAAHTVSGEALPFEKIDRNTWRVVTSGEADVVVTYRNYANVLDAGESFLDETEAYLNPISVLMNVPGRLEEPVGLTIKQPANWRLVTPLAYDDTAQAYIAEDYHELVDSPFLVSPNVDVLSFDWGGATFDIAVQGNWDYDRARLIADHKAIVDAQAEIMSGFPFEKYLFMYHIMDSPMGHGVEHKNSTSIVLGPAAAMTMPAEGNYADGMYRSFLGVASHEFFHAWNVERIRPAAMYPTDYSTEQYTTQMWIFEGITDYYADVALFRAGLSGETGMLNGLAGTVMSFDGDPGRKITSVAMSSFDSWAKQDDAPPNTFYSFYTAGKALGLTLDMEVRGRTGGEKSLDDVFRYLYAEYPMKDRGVPESGFQDALEAVSGTSFESFFNDHIYGTEDVDWNAHLEHGGLSLVERASDDPAAWMRVFFGGTTILGIDPSGVAGTAGLAEGDKLVRVGEMAITDGESIKVAFAAYAPGDRVLVAFSRNGDEQSVEIEVGEPPKAGALEVLDSSSALQTTIRNSWMGKSE